MVSLALDGAHSPTEGEGWWAGLGFGVQGLGVYGFRGLGFRGFWVRGWSFGGALYHDHTRNLGPYCWW